MKRSISVVLSVILLLTVSLPAHAGEPMATGTNCYSIPAAKAVIYLPLVAAGEGDQTMSKSEADSRLAVARQRLGKALSGAFQAKVSYRTAFVDFIEYDDDGGIKTCTVTVDGVSGVPMLVNPAERIATGDAVRVENRGSAAGPSYRFDQMITSSYAAGTVSPAASLPTPTGLSLSSKRHVNTSDGHAIVILTAAWRALAERAMGQGGYYEIQIRRSDDVDGHTSRAPHQLGSTTLDVQAAYNDGTIYVDDASDFPAQGRLLLADSEVVYTNKSAGAFTGLTWYGGGAGSPYAVDTEINGLTMAYQLHNLQPGWSYSVRVRAVAGNGATSDWTSWSSLEVEGPVLSVSDQFNDYGGRELSTLEHGLFWLQLLTFDTNEVWTALTNPTGGTISGASDPSNVLQGDAGYKITCTFNTDDREFVAAHAYSPILDLSQEGRFTDDDFVVISIYNDNQPIDAFYLWMKTDHNQYYKATLDTNVTTTGWHHYKVKKSDFSAVESPNWASIAFVWVSAKRVTPSGTQVTNITFDDLRVCKADPNDATTFNETGGAWAFEPPISDGGPQWHIYAGN